MRLATFALLACLGHQLSAATLTGVTFFSADSQGNSTLEVWNTVGGDIPFNLYLYDGVNAINTGNGSGASINIPLLTSGTYTFIFKAQPGLQTPTHFGVNLFFDGATNTPGISALVTANSSTFVANGSPLTPRLDGLPIVSGSNTLTYINGFYTTTLIALSESKSGGNQVGGYTNTPGLVGGNDYVGSFALSVATPEPGTYLMLGTSLMALGLFRRRRVL